jgi:hypothetical protein
MVRGGGGGGIFYMLGFGRKTGSGKGLGGRIHDVMRCGGSEFGGESGL